MKFVLRVLLALAFGFAIAGTVDACSQAPVATISGVAKPDSK